jgi:hypothetical protein
MARRGRFGWMRRTGGGARFQLTQINKTRKSRAKGRRRRRPLSNYDPPPAAAPTGLGRSPLSRTRRQKADALVDGEQLVAPVVELPARI